MNILLFFLAMVGSCVALLAFRSGLVSKVLAFIHIFLVNGFVFLMAITNSEAAIVGWKLIMMLNTFILIFLFVAAIVIFLFRNLNSGSKKLSRIINRLFIVFLIPTILIFGIDFLGAYLRSIGIIIGEFEVLTIYAISTIIWGLIYGKCISKISLIYKS